jgi:hypothetical protein
MNSRLTGFLLLFLLAQFTLPAQEILKPLSTDSASIQLKRQIEYRQLVSGELLPPENIIAFPKFDFNSGIDQRYTIGLTHGFNNGLANYSYFSAATTSPYFSPFYGNGMILSEGAYQLGSKFVLGGYSYGINSPFFAPLPNASNKFDRYGSTLYMQYKVGKNFKIETRFNVTPGGVRPGF